MENNNPTSVCRRFTRVRAVNDDDLRYSRAGQADMRAPRNDDDEATDKRLAAKATIIIVITSTRDRTPGLIGSGHGLAAHPHWRTKRFCSSIAPAILYPITRNNSMFNVQ